MTIRFVGTETSADVTAGTAEALTDMELPFLRTRNVYLMRLAKPLNAASSDATIEAEQRGTPSEGPQGLLFGASGKFGWLCRSSCCFYAGMIRLFLFFTLIQVPILKQRPKKGSYLTDDCL